MQVTKDILVQYCEMRQEVRDLRERIEKSERKLEAIESEGEVSDIVTGTRSDGTIGGIRISGFPTPEYDNMKSMIRKRNLKLRILEDDLQEALNAVDNYIAAIPQSDLRMIFRLYYIDNMTWVQVANRMNGAFPKRRIKYTEDSCRKRHDRYIEKSN